MMMMMMMMKPIFGASLISQGNFVLLYVGMLSFIKLLNRKQYFVLCV